MGSRVTACFWPTAAVRPEVLSAEHLYLTSIPLLFVGQSESFPVCWVVLQTLGVSVHLGGWGDALARGRSPLGSPSLCLPRHGFSVSASRSLCVLVYLSVLSLSRV